jgi:hypothetical protein
MNRRSRTRFKTDLTANIICSDLPDNNTKARLANLSVHGLSLILNKKLNVGSLAKVEWGTVTFMGEVVYCRPHGKEVIVGLKVDDPVYETAKKSASQ